MSNSSHFRTDQELVQMFDQKGHNWLIRGGPIGMLGAPSPDLQSALVQSFEQNRANQIVQAIVRQPSDNIVIEPPQITRLLKWITITDDQGRVTKPASRP